MPGKIRLIVNRAARSGCKRRLLDQVRRELGDLDLEVLVPDSYEELIAMARRAPQDGVDTVLVLGGDGTINAVLNQLVHTDVALGVIPAGTANDLAGFLGISRKVREACAVVRRGKRKRLDLIEVNGRYFVTAGGIGVVSDTAVGVNRLKASGGLLSKLTKWLGGMVYVLYSFALLAASREIVSPLDVSVDGKPQGEIPTIALFVNNQPTLGKTVMPYPGARSDDGELGLCIMRQRSRLGAIWTVILMSLRGAHTKRKDILMMPGKSLSIRSPRPTTFIGDGEVLAHDCELSLRVVPKAIRVLA